MIVEFNLNDEPWSYLLKCIDFPSMKVKGILLGTKFKYSVMSDMRNISLCRYIVINSEKYIPFASYISGLLSRYEGDYSIPKFILCNDTTYLAETYSEAFEKGCNGKLWGNKNIDRMLSFIRKKPNGLNPSF